MSKAVYRSASCCVLAVTIMAGGCGKKPEPPKKSEPVRVMSAVSIVPRPMQVLPARHPGLWETSVREDGSDDVQTLQICIDSVTDIRLGLRGNDLGGDRCGPKSISRIDADSWKVMTTCQVSGGGTEAYSGTFSGDFATDYTMKLRVQTTGGAVPQMNRAANYIIESKRVGDCGPDQAPGDLTNDGVTVNLFEMEGHKAPAS